MHGHGSDCIPCAYGPLLWDVLCEGHNDLEQETLYSSSGKSHPFCCWFAMDVGT